MATRWSCSWSARRSVQTESQESAEGSETSYQADDGHPNPNPKVTPGKLLQPSRGARYAGPRGASTVPRARQSARSCSSMTYAADRDRRRTASSRRQPLAAAAAAAAVAAAAAAARRRRGGGEAASLSREHYGYFKAPRGGGGGLVRSLTRRLSSIKGMATRNSKPNMRRVFVFNQSTSML